MENQFIKSFEIAGDGEVGDIVSKDRKKARGKLKVGVLPLSWFEWWPMYPESGLRESILADSDRFVERMQEKFGDKYDLVIPNEHIDTLNKAYDVGEYFKREGIDAIIIDESTYITDFIPIQAIDALPDIPVILFVTQASDNLWDTMCNTDVIRYEGLVGNTQLAGAFKKMGRKYRAVVGSLEDEEAFAEIGKHLSALQLISDLKYMDIGFVGHTFRGMYDIEVDKTKIKGVFGPNVLYLDVTHLIDIWNALSEDEISAYVEQIKCELPYKFEGIDEEDVRKSVSLGLAVRKLIAKFGIDGLTLLGQHHVEVATRASADLSFYCAENDGCMTSHEGDLANLVMKYILNHISGDLPVFLEWSAFDIKTDTLLLTHHGVVDPKIHAADQNKCRVTPSPEKWDFTGHGMSVEYMSKSGKVTLACLIDAKDGWKLLLSGGECLELPQAPSFAPQFRFKHESLSVKNYLKQIIEEGVAHHVCLVYGDYREDLKLWAQYTGLNIVEI
ncbi:MAG: hypothetical protein IJO09_00550 [Oscillospiraceae bacterium]|nr:hypothetical protein [Oscillospiraceae bacterium]